MGIGWAKGQTLYPKLGKTIAMKTIEVGEIDAGAIEELANNRVIDWHSARTRIEALSSAAVISCPRSRPR